MNTVNNVNDFSHDLLQYLMSDIHNWTLTNYVVIWLGGDPMVVTNDMSVVNTCKLNFKQLSIGFSNSKYINHQIVQLYFFDDTLKNIYFWRSIDDHFRHQITIENDKLYIGDSNMVCIGSRNDIYDIVEFVSLIVSKCWCSYCKTDDSVNEIIHILSDFDVIKCLFDKPKVGKEIIIDI